MNNIIIIFITLYLTMTEGHLYCFSNPCMPGIVKVGMTIRTPQSRLNEANASDTWRPPTPYKIEFAKKVCNPKEKEKTIHIILEQYTDRINPRREFFKVSPDEVRKLFDLMDGEMWAETPTVEENDDDEDEDEDDEDNYETTCDRTCVVEYCRDMTQCFTNDQRIRHIIGINKTWVGVYDSSKNMISYNNEFYTLNAFASSHYKVERPDRTAKCNAWSECECEINEEWVSTYRIPIRS